MGASFFWRRTTAQDLVECLQLRPVKRGAENIGVERATRAWFKLLDLPYASRSALVEMHSPGKVEIVGFGFSTFVKKRFAESELNDPRPNLNVRIIESVDSGRSAVASLREVKQANTQGNLQQVILNVCWKGGRLDAAQVDEVRMLLGRAYQEMHAGYCISRVMYELIGDIDFWHARDHPGFRIIDRFKAYGLQNSQTDWGQDRALGVATIESIDIGSIAAAVFKQRRRPRFAFTLSEQQLLEVALDGLDDVQASRCLFVSVPAIKQRWAKIFNRVTAVNPEICPPIEGARRGIQKRRTVLAYINKHPEELRPFQMDDEPD